MDDADDWDDAVWSTIDALETSHRQSRLAGEASSHAPADAQWACRSCTLLNSAARTACSVCNTPRGHVYTQTDHAHATEATATIGGSALALGAAAASAAPSFSLLQPKKTVQATLPFSKTGGPSTTASTPSASRTAANDASSQWRGNAKKTGAVADNVAWSNGAVRAPSRGPAAMGSKSTTPLNFPLSRNEVAPTNGNDMDDDMDDAVGGIVGIAVAARLRHKGEDPAAKMRYLPAAPPDTQPRLHHHPQIDRDAASSFVYPTNYSVREYQLTIAEKALYHNTLVSLPTGLGKTLIASVVMYNFYRWFPQGQIVFMAPTKPLVAQQIGACHEIMGIPLSDTAELQGSVPPSTRKILWSTKRVFFCTPQSMQNDLQRGICRAERLVCLVVDEAHRATGNYAYCGVIQEVEKLTTQFRVLALSATPGAKFDVIQDVIRNLRITHIESRSADDADVKKYTHARQEEVIKCSLNSQIAETKTLFLRVFERITQRLLAGNILQHKDPERLTRWYVLQMRERFRTSPNYQSNRGAESDLAVLVSLLHARDLLTAHGLASFKTWLDGFVNGEQENGKRVSWSKKELLQSTEFQALRLSLEHVGGGENSSSGSGSHPKLLKLREVLHEHFQRHAAGQSSTRAIVFTQYRTSVQEIVKLLEPLFPLIKAQQFIGQGASGKAKESKGQTQKEQQEIVRKFRSGLFNVLVATCIAEEGLDIGEVDLIVSFDALTSPVRMIQRMGRTGRKRVGKVVILVTEGDEEKKLARSVASAKTVSRALTTFKSKFVYGTCARMIPDGISPELVALAMDIPEFHASQIAGKQTSSRARADGEGVNERRDAWKLNELERSIVRGKYMAKEWSDTPRHEFRPITAIRKVLIRRRRATEQGGSTSSRSRALLTLVRTINGVHYDDEACADRCSGLKATPPLSSLDAYRVIGQHDGDVLDFSDPDDGKEYDHQMHFSPPYSGAPTASQPISPVRSNEARTPRSNDPTHQTKRSTPIAGCGEPPSAARASPLRQATITGKPSPSPSKRSSTGSGRKVRKKVEKPRGAIDEGLLERGERLLERISAMLSVSSAVAAEASSPEPEPAVPPDDWAPTQLEFELPRIARRLKFDDANEGKVSTIANASRRDNCVPPPPTLQDIFSPKQTKKIIPAMPDYAPALVEQALTLPQSAHPDKNVEGKRAVENAREPISSASGVQSSIIGQPRSSMEDEHVIPRGEFGATVASKAFIQSRPKKSKGSLALRVPVIDKPALTAYSPGRIEMTAVSTTASTTVMTATRDHSKEGVLKNLTSEVQLGVGVTTNSSEGDLMQMLSQRRNTQVGSTQGEPCSVCCEHESFDDDPIVFCDGCDAAIHQFCYGIPVLPSGQWYCDSCTAFCVQGRLPTKPKPRRCALCPMRTLSLAMKRTECDQWVHVQCFMWIPELRFHFEESKTLRLGQLGRLDPERKTLDCSLCHSKRGYGTIQCAHKRCLNAFHVSCASGASDYRLLQLEQSEGAEEETLFIAYCPLHNKSKATSEPKRDKLQSSPYGRFPDASHGNPVRSPARSTVLSPSALFASQGDSSKKQRKQFRRLKRKYDTAILTDRTADPRTPPNIRSPWAKRVRRSQQHAEGKRAQAKALARMFIDDEVDAPSSGGEDDDEDDEMTEEDRDFINDSSQLIYSPSVPTPVRKKKRKRNSLGDMRAIYARSLLESPQTPAFLRRRGRGNLPSGGIINACLEELHEEKDARLCESPSSCTKKSQASISATEVGEPAGVIEILDDSQADEHSNHGEVDMVVTDIAEPSLPCFDLLGAATAAAAPVGQAEATRPTPEAPRPTSERVDFETDESRRLRAKIEANRLKALQLLEAKKMAVKPLKSATCSSALPGHDHEEVTRDKLHRNNQHGARLDAAGSSQAVSAMHPIRDDPVPTTFTTELGRDSRVSNHIFVYVQPAFRESPIFDVFMGSKMADSDKFEFRAIESLDANVLLSLRVAATIVDLHSADTSGLHQHPMLESVRVVYKSFLLVIRGHDMSTVRKISQSEAVRHLRELPSCRNVIVACDDTVIVRAMLMVAREEMSLGFGLPDPMLTRSNPTVGDGVDRNFHDRFRFFQATGLLSMGSVISLSFRFDKFTVKQIPVTKFSEMHWRRMLPWITESVAGQLHRHFTHSST